MNSYDIIRRPILTEKSYAGIAAKTYTFEVAKAANKVEIKKAVEEVFGVKVEKVTTVTVKGKLKRQGRTQGYTPDWKKATVTLSKDSKSIEFFDSLS
ncbi:MAG: 50S ribosomal protein L23 [Clostridia bacterium]|nr:50S ribosomal protein L23 [Clostridia bacterium]